MAEPTQASTPDKPDKHWLFKKGQLKPGQWVGLPKGFRTRATRVAQALLVEHQEEAVNVVLDMMREPEPSTRPPCPLCGAGMPETTRQKDLRLRAAVSALDRSGLGPQSKVTVEESSDTAWMAYLSDEQLDMLSGWIDDARDRMPAEQPVEEQQVQ